MARDGIFWAFVIGCIILAFLYNAEYGQNEPLRHQIEDLEMERNAYQESFNQCTVEKQECESAFKDCAAELKKYPVKESFWDSLQKIATIASLLALI